MRFVLAFLIILMPGCAAVPELPNTFTGTCALKPIGSTEGLMFVMAHCEAAK